MAEEDTDNQDVRELLESLEEYESQPASYGLDLRVSFAEVVLRQLQQLGWNQRMLAEVAGVKEPVISRIIHSEANCTFKTAGKLLHALGIRAQLQESEPIGTASCISSEVFDGTAFFVKVVNIDAYEKTTPKEITQEATQADYAFIKEG